MLSKLYEIQEPNVEVTRLIQQGDYERLKGKRILPPAETCAPVVGFFCNSAQAKRAFFVLSLAQCYGADFNFV
jgi:hypothetical protein